MSFISKPDTVPKIGCATVLPGYFATLCFSANQGGASHWSPAANSVFCDIHLTRSQLEKLHQAIGDYLARPPKYAVEKSQLPLDNSDSEISE